MNHHIQYTAVQTFGVTFSFSAFFLIYFLFSVCHQTIHKWPKRKLRAKGYSCTFWFHRVVVTALFMYRTPFQCLRRMNMMSNSRVMFCIWLHILCMPSLPDVCHPSTSGYLIFRSSCKRNFRMDLNGSREGRGGLGGGGLRTRTAARSSRNQRRGMETILLGEGMPLPGSLDLLALLGDWGGVRCILQPTRMVIHSCDFVLHGPIRRRSMLPFK